MELFGRVFIDDVGAEPGSIIAQLGGFPFKEAKFRREMEKLRNGQQRDLTFNKVRRILFEILCSIINIILFINRLNVTEASC